jgi:hypothetical protein
VSVAARHRRHHAGGRFRTRTEHRDSRVTVSDTGIGEPCFNGPTRPDSTTMRRHRVLAAILLASQAIFAVRPMVAFGASERGAEAHASPPRAVAHVGHGAPSDARPAPDGTADCHGAGLAAPSDEAPTEHREHAAGCHAGPPCCAPVLPASIVSTQTFAGATTGTTLFSAVTAAAVALIAHRLPPATAPPHWA